MRLGSLISQFRDHAGALCRPLRCFALSVLVAPLVSGCIPYIPNIQTPGIFNSTVVPENAVGSGGPEKPGKISVLPSGQPVPSDMTAYKNWVCAADTVQYTVIGHGFGSSDKRATITLEPNRFTDLFTYDGIQMFRAQGDANGVTQFIQVIRRGSPPVEFWRNGRLTPEMGEFFREADSHARSAIQTIVDNCTGNAPSNFQAVIAVPEFRVRVPHTNYVVAQIGNDFVSMSRSFIRGVINGADVNASGDLFQLPILGNTDSNIASLSIRGIDYRLFYNSESGRFYTSQPGVRMRQNMGTEVPAEVQSIMRQLQRFVNMAQPILANPENERYIPNGKFSATSLPYKLTEPLPADRVKLKVAFSDIAPN